MRKWQGSPELFRSLRKRRTSERASSEGLGASIEAAQRGPSVRTGIGGKEDKCPVANPIWPRVGGLVNENRRVAANRVLLEQGIAGISGLRRRKRYYRPMNPPAGAVFPGR